MAEKDASIDSLELEVSTLNTKSAKQFADLV